MLEQHAPVSGLYRHHRAKVPTVARGHCALLRGQGVVVALRARKAFEAGHGVGGQTNGHQIGGTLKCEVVGQRPLVAGHGHTRHHLHTAADGQTIGRQGLLGGELHRT